MCKVIIVLNKKGENTGVINTIIQNNIDNLSKEYDGYSVYRKGKGSSFYYGLSEYSSSILEKNLVYRGESFYITHFRSSTTGEKGTEGLHLHKINNRYIFAHNGIIDAFNKVKTKNDSFYFFKRLLAYKKGKINPDIINECIKEYGFSGKGFLYDEKKEVLHMFVNMKMYMIVLNDALIFSTFDMKKDIKVFDNKNILGMKFKIFKEEIKIPQILFEDSIDNKYYKFTHEVLTEEGKIENRTTVYRKEYSIPPNHNLPFGKQITSYD